jgi:hypothetical protein
MKWELFPKRLTVTVFKLPPDFIDYGQLITARDRGEHAFGTTPFTVY